MERGNGGEVRQFMSGPAAPQIHPEFRFRLRRPGDSARHHPAVTEAFCHELVGSTPWWGQSKRFPHRGPDNLPKRRTFGARQR